MIKEQAVTQLPLPPGNLGLPLIGETFQFLFDRQFHRKHADRYGMVFKTSLLGKPTICMVGPDAARFVLSSQTMEHFSWGDGWPQSFKALLGRSLFVQDGEEHRRNRRLMMPAFHGRALVGYIETIETITRRYLNKWEQLGRFSWFHENKQLTFEIASQIFLGANPGSDTARLSKLFTELTGGLFGLVPSRSKWTRFGRGMAARAELLEYIMQAVEERQRNPGLDALSLLVQARDEDGQSLSTDELTAQAMLLLFAGHETTTSMITSLCLELALHPEVLAKARDEQKQFAATDDPLTLEQIGQMSYLEQVLREVERLHPPVAGGFRGVVKAYDFNGYHIPAGWKVLYNIPDTQSIAKGYTSPDRFDPDRFSPAREEHKAQAFSLIGFGGGPRICLGMSFAQLEMKIIAARLLREYRWEILPNQRLDWMRIPTLHPKDGLRVAFQRL